jgi:hypothetical protein
VEAPTTGAGSVSAVRNIMQSHVSHRTLLTPPCNIAKSCSHGDAHRLSMAQPQFEVPQTEVSALPPPQWTYARADGSTA